MKRSVPALFAILLVAFFGLDALPYLLSNLVGSPPVESVGAPYVAQGVPDFAAGSSDFPSPRGFVNDFAGLLTQTEIDELEGRLRALESATTAEVVVVTVPSTEPYTMNEYAVELFEQWSVGKKGADNGVLFLIAAGDQREVRIEVGYGLEGALPDGRVGEILDEAVIPAFREGDWAGGIRGGVEALVAYIQLENAGSGVPTGTSPIRDLVAPVATILVVVLVVIIRSLIVLKRLPVLLRSRCPDCGHRMSAVDRVVEAATYDSHGTGLRVYTCRHCGHSEEQEFRIPRKVRWIGPGGFGGGGFGGGFGGLGRGFGGSGGFRRFGGGRSGGGGAGRKF